MKIAILNITRMGDIVQSSQLIKALKKKYPDSQIIYMVLENFKETTKLIEEIDETISFNFAETLKNIDLLDLNKAFESLSKIVENINNKKFDIAINLSFSKLSAILMYFINAKEKRGFVFNNKAEYLMFDEWSRFFMSIVDYRELCPFNLVDIYTKIGGVNPSCDKTSNKKFTYSPNFGFVLGASTKDRMWPVSNFNKLAKLINENYPESKIFLFGAPSEKYLGDLFFEKNKNIKNIINLIGKTTILELYNFIKNNVDIVITNDTGAMHIGWYAGKKIIELSLGPALYNTTGPYGYGHIVLQPNIECSPCSYRTECKTLECLNYITPEDVLLSIKILLKTTNLKKISSKVKIFMSDFDLNGFVRYIPEMKESVILRKIWIDILENKKYENKNLNFLPSDLKNIFDDLDIICQSILKIIQKNVTEVEKIIDILYKKEDELRILIEAKYNYFLPFFKFFKYSKVLLPEDDIEKCILELKLLYEILKYQINMYIVENKEENNENFHG